MKTPEHTPTPYTCTDDDCLQDNQGIEFARVYGKAPQRQERATFIVTACNSQDNLRKQIAKLRTIIPKIRQACSGTAIPDYYGLVTAITEAEAVLAETKEST